MLPWGPTFLAEAHDDIGKSLLTAGIYDLSVSESLFRLTPPDGIAVDVGANIGYTTALLASRAKHGRVYSFEPHPEVFRDLQTNVNRWKDLDIAKPELINRAVGDTEAEVTLIQPTDFKANRGISHVSKDGLKKPGTNFKVQSILLDDFFRETARIHVMKVDVEGYELEVFRGAKELLVAKRISHIVFEEHRAYPAPTHLFLEEMGYHLFSIQEEMAGPQLIRDLVHWQRPTFSPANYIATAKPDDIIEAFGAKGWRCLA